MTTAARSRYRTVVDTRRWIPDRRTVAKLATVVGRDVRRRLARRSRTVVATYTITSDTDVAEISRRPCTCRVAGIALTCRDNVASRLSSCYRAVMTTATRTEHCAVIDAHSWPPQRGVMASIATVIAGDMGRRFAGGTHAVVAARTSTRGNAVVEMRGRPSGGGMTGVALRRRRDMRARFARCGCTVVTATATAHNLRVIDTDSRCPLTRVVATIAGGAAVDVTAIFSYCAGAVVTRSARLSDTRVIEASGRPSCCVVAADAVVTALDMHRRFTCGNGIVVAALA